MFTRSFLIGALALAGAEAFAPGAAMLRPASSARAGLSARPLSMQIKEGTEAEKTSDGPQSVSTGGTQLVKVKNMPLFSYNSNLPEDSVIGDGKMAGDKGFDPLGFATTVERLRIYREAELKHGRLAMLAALGWPVAEALNGPLSKLAGMQSTLVASTGTPLFGGDNVVEILKLSPSVLNGGLETISPIYWAAVLAFGAGTELYATKIQRRAGFSNTLAALGVEDVTGIDIDGDGQVGAPKMLAAESYLPGDLGFDPLGLYKGTDKHKAALQLKEVNNGRLAMIAIAGYAIAESAGKVSIISEGGAWYLNLWR